MAHRSVHSAVRALSRAAIAAALLSAAPHAWAHADRAAVAGDALTPWIAGMLVVAAALYAAGLYRAASLRRPRRALIRHAVMFAAGWTTLALALVWPLAGLTAGLFSAHMIQHELLMVVAAPLLVLGRPLAIWTWALPRRWRRIIARPFRRGAFESVWRAVSSPAGATLIHAAAIWVWHVPRIFELSEESVAAHAFQHIAFLFSALLFWWALFKPARGGRIGAAVACLFITMLHTGALGVLLTFAGDVWYAAATANAARWGLTPLEDQQLGGLVMWVIGGLPYVTAALVLAARWFTSSDSRGDVALRLSSR